jgi:hypothetical protein
MIVKKYGIELHRLKLDDIELVRQKRNEKAIREKMFYQKIITFEEQKSWFESINNIYNYYFVIHYKNKKVGLIHGKIHSFEERVAEGGIFVWDEEAYNSIIPVISSVCMADITFFMMNMKKTLADVRIENKIALEYNLKLGYEVVSEHEKENRLRLELTKDNYLKKSKKIRAIVKKIGKDDTDVSWDDISLPVKDIGKIYEGLPSYIQANFDKIRENA